MNRLATLVAMALWMLVASMLIHESGHVLGALLTGGTITSLELRPGRIGHTLVCPDAAPSVVLWSGFLVGWIAPMATQPAWSVRRGLAGPALRAAAWFSWLAFGSYLALAGGERLTDTGQLLNNGWSPAFLVGVGGVVAVIGYWRSRNAWSMINAHLSETTITWRLPSAWWGMLAAWCVAQFALATWLTTAMLGPHSNVR